MKKTKKRRFIMLDLVLGILCGCNYLYKKILGDKDKWRERTFKRMNEDLSGQVDPILGLDKMLSICIMLSIWTTL